MRVEYGDNWLEIYKDNLALYRGPHSAESDKILDAAAADNNEAIEYVVMDFKD
jgi:hypothetical protein